mgnify:CR=1 FL=1
MPARVPDLIALDSPLARQREVVGGKGAHLGMLVSLGLPVPGAVVVSAGAFVRHLAHHGLRERARRLDPALAEELRRLPLAPTLAGRLREASAGLGEQLAVRSSAVGEDSAEASHAGQFDTVLGVGPGDALEDALRACWASAFSERARAYRQGAAARQRSSPQMAVVVQTMVHPRAAGVVFTINPATGAWTEMTVEAAWGLGEAVVSGQVLPDFHRVRRPRRLPPGLRRFRRLAARLRLVELEREINRQEHALAIGEDGGVETVSVPPSRRDSPKLSPAEVARLCRMALRIEAHLGHPQDVEWAIDEAGALHILQTRPVTAAKAVKPHRGVVWTRRFVGERWTEPATPLGWSLVRRELDWLIAYPETNRRFLGGGAPTRLHRCAPYMNSTVFRHLAFKLPGAPPPRFMLELLPPAEEAGWLRRRAAPPDLRVYASIFRTTFQEKRWRRFRWNPLRNWAHWDSFADDLPARIDALPPVRQARSRAEAAQALARDYIKIHVCSLLFANIGYEIAAARISASVRPALAERVLRPLRPSATVQAHHDLWMLGQGTASLESVLARHGRRAPSSWELFSPRWCESPEQVAPLAAAVGHGPDPLIGARASIAEADEAMAELPAELRPFVTLVRRYLQLREDQRVAFEAITWAWKEAWLALEAETGLSLRFLDIDEADGLLAQRLDRGLAEALIARRSEEYRSECARWAAGDEPPAFLGEVESMGPRDRRMRGRGISAGVARGPARVAHTLADAQKLRPGEILVSRATDPGWTPLFRTAGGLVLEQGGMLSHGAVVAREYGLPAVVNVVDACRHIATGQSVTVDGGRGVVVLS